MREYEAIVQAYDRACQQALPCVLATVVHVEGSAFRQAGVRMLVDAYGNMTGAISGGCLEGDARRKALHALEQQRNKLVTYDTRDEDDAFIGAQLGCNGLIQVLFEPLHPSDPHNPVELLRQAIAQPEPAVLVVRFHLDPQQPQPGTRLLLDAQLSPTGDTGDPQEWDILQQEAQAALASGQSRALALNGPAGTLTAFLQLRLPPPQLVIAGAGPDAQVLAQMADLLGWDILVLDGRPTHARPERFAAACQVMVCKPEQMLAAIPPRPQTAVVLLTHNYPYDLAALTSLIQRPDIAYLGLLGPRKKYERMLDDLATQGIRLHPEQAERIFAPVGLHLGAETPAEIALAILAEIQSVLSGTDATPLRQRTTPIHDRRPPQLKTISY